MGKESVYAQGVSDEACHARWAKGRNNSAGTQCGATETFDILRSAAFFKICNVLQGAADAQVLQAG